MERYRILGKKGEGTFSEVLKCQYIRDGTYWAAKKMKQTYKSIDEIQQIREIRVLRQLNGHPNIIFLREIIFDKRNGTLCLIFELMAMNLYEYIRGRQRLLANEVVCKFMYQLLKALEFLHRHNYFHRDVKPENILIKDDTLKLADFGSCRQTHSKQPFTEYISTRWYRAPESLLTNGYYRDLTDIWSAGCVMYEIATLRPLFPGTNELDQISKIHDVLGTPSASTLEKFQHRNTAVDFNFPPRRGTGIARRLTHCSSDAIDLINQLCVYDPDYRFTAAQALQHPYFDTAKHEENPPIHVVNETSWETNTQVSRPSQDQYTRPDSNSSKSTADEPVTSTRSNIYNPTTIHQQILEPNFHRLLQPPAKAQSLVDARIQGQAPKKSFVQHKSHTKSKHMHPSYPYPQYIQPQVYYHSLATVGPNGIPYQTSPNGQLIKNSHSSFLPRIAGVSAFSNYSIESGYSVPTAHKVAPINAYPTRQAAAYYPIIAYRPYKK
ncbi:unnamed protein product [Adineta ricciae]|uniref:Protein kinase domain-containing protein n=1 Tax=Adineta ricciae TaxID=249248 RepID=A0A814K743_ADIRI|nr:unnamed protein product [Adineta ricciae]CAF1428798.1 unnamed protein product [Adineta ricciae]